MFFLSRFGGFFIRTFIFLLLVFYGLSSGADYRDTVFVKSGWHCGENVATSCIIVRRGCDENRYPIGDFVDSKESEEQLLVRVFGAEPQEDSSSTYSDWGISCSMGADVSYEGRGFLLNRTIK